MEQTMKNEPKVGGKVYVIHYCYSNLEYKLTEHEVLFVTKNTILIKWFNSESLIKYTHKEVRSVIGFKSRTYYSWTLDKEIANEILEESNEIHKNNKED